MLTPEQIAAYRDQAGKITDPINNYLLRDIARRIADAGQLTSTAAYEVWRMQQMGKSQRQIKKELKKLLKVSNRELRKLLTQSAEVGYDFDIRHLPQVQAVQFEKNISIQQIVAAAVALAQDDFSNITQTLGMVDPYGKALPLQEVYRSCTDFAFEQVITGAADYNTALRRATKNLAEHGVQVIEYESGVRTSLEAAVRRNIMGGMGLMQEQISQSNHDELGADGWELSAHANSAPDHEPFQGKQYTDAEYEAINGSLVRRISTLNCGHVAFPIILGVSEPQYTPEQLQQFREDNEKGVTIDGKHYTGYEATQMQRKIERTIRKQKKRVLVDEATGDEEKLLIDRIKLQRLNQEYTRFSKAAGLRTEPERLHIAEVQRAAVKRKSPVAINPKSAIMGNNDKSGEGVSVQSIGKIDVEKYRCVATDIITDEVIITEERIGHIKKRHPNDYERYSSYIAEAVINPDYILEDPHPATALILKEIKENGEHFRLTLRLVTNTDNPAYKNSVITFLKIREKEWRRLLNNKKILYKADDS